MSYRKSILAPGAGVAGVGNLSPAAWPSRLRFFLRPLFCILVSGPVRTMARARGHACCDEHGESSVKKVSQVE